jgi:glycosyltransferase involved in cell wall biosynthesis
VIPKVGRSLYGFLMFFALLPMLWKLKKQNPKNSVVFSQWLYPDGFAAYLAAKCLGLPIVLSAAGCDINEYTKYFWRRLWITKALKGANHNIMVSTALKDKAIALGVPADKMTVNMNGSNASVFYPRDKQESRSTLNQPSNKKLLTYIGNFNEEKGVKYLVSAFALIAKEQPDVNLYLVGDGPLKAELVEQITTAQLTERIVFTGRVDHSQVPLYLSSADLLCLPSLREGCPNVVIEALSCGTPVVASQVGAVPDILASSGEPLGYMAKPEDPKDLAEALLKALKTDFNIPAHFTWPSWQDSSDKTSEILDRY